MRESTETAVGAADGSDDEGETVGRTAGGDGSGVGLAEMKVGGNTVAILAKNATGGMMIHAKSKLTPPATRRCDIDTMLRTNAAMNSGTATAKAQPERRMKSIPTPKHTHPPISAPCFTFVSICGATRSQAKYGRRDCPVKDSDSD